MHRTAGRPTQSLCTLFSRLKHFAAAAAAHQSRQCRQGRAGATTLGERKVNPNLQTILSLLDSVRRLTATAVTTQGRDGRLYVQVVGVPGFPVFTINVSGKYDLPFEHSYTNAGMTKMGLPILAAKPEGLNAVLFADKLAERPRNRHDLCVGFDPVAIERVRQMAVMEAPQDAWRIWREPGHAIPHSASNEMEQLSELNRMKPSLRKRHVWHNVE